MNSLGLGFLTFGMILLTLGGLGAVGYIPFPSLSQSSVCIQSIVKMASVCSSALSTGMDSISYAGLVIAPTANPVSVSQSQSQGSLIGYYFLASGTTLRSSSASYCSGQGCSPNTPLSTTSSASSSVVGLYLLTTQSPSMTVGTYYTYQFSITDSAGVSSTISGTVVVIAAAPTWTASVTTYNGTYSLGGSSGAGVAGFNVYNVETPNFLITITNNAPISSITLNVSPGGQSLGFTYIGNNQWQEAYSTFAVGQYTVSAVIKNSQPITAFSLRMTSINQLKLTGVTLTTYTTSCPYSTSTASSAPYSVTLCQVTQGQTLTVSNSGCYTGTATTISSSTLQGTTCSTGAVTCSAGGCQGTTTTTSGTGTTSGGSTTTGSSTTSTSSTSTSTSKTTVCPNSLACSPSSIPLLPSLVFITGIVFTAIGGFMTRKPEGGQG